jgi:hypothetical protein
MLDIEVGRLAPERAVQVEEDGLDAHEGQRRRR